MHTGVEIRPATTHDVAPIVALLADDPHQHLVVAERAGDVVGTVQLTIIPGLSRRAPRVLISRASESGTTSVAPGSGAS